MIVHVYTDAEQKFITENIKGKSVVELTEIFNKYFSLALAVSQIKGFIKNHKLRSGLDGRFLKGRVSHNKGKKGTGGWEPTHFKKGHKPDNYLPVGSERVNGDGYAEYKVADPHKWKGKHIILWEEKNGPVPNGHCIIFGDKNKLNFELSNLICVSRKQLLVLNHFGLIREDSDFTRTGIIIADIKLKTSERRK